ncbi:MAG TPA: hypothetical protein VL197_15115 [Nitrospirota bacterium]|nr:hypothetical protein [Nitrospirota bacterium]
MTLSEPPPGWGSDNLTKYLDDARHNAYASFHNLRDEYRRLSDIDTAFRKAIDSLLNTADWFAAFFLLRSHSSFLAGLSLSMSGQVPEGYACLRLALENSLYGFYLSKNPSSQITWLNRHESAEAKKKVRDEFKIRALLASLKTSNPAEGTVVEALYDRTIDYGAHPNERALMQNLRMEKSADGVQFQVAYLTDDTMAFRLLVKTVAQVGVCSLEIFRLIYRERFDITGLTDMLQKLKHGL